MASLLLPRSLQRAPFVCESCLKRLRPLGSAHTIYPRQSNATFSNRAAASPRSSTHFARDARRSHSHRYQSALVKGVYSHRQYSASSSPSEPAPSGLAPLPFRRLVSLSGPDAAKFLQGLVTNNVDSNRQTPFYSAFLDARGRVLWDVFIWVYPELLAKEGDWACHIEVDAGEIETLVKHMKRHKLRSKIKIAVVEESDLGVWASWGNASENLDSAQIVASLTDPRAHSMGTRLLLKDNRPPDDLPIPPVDPEQYHLRRYLLGIPEGPHEISREGSLPMECNIDLSQGIDFKKGCYVGQELTIRTKHTGVVRKRMLPVQLYTSLKPTDLKVKHPTFDASWPTKAIPGNGIDIKQLDEQGSIKKGRATGKFVTGVGNVGLALCRLEMMTSMRVSAEGGSWKPDAEFGVQMGEDIVRVRAFAPQWFRERERNMWDKNRTRM